MSTTRLPPAPKAEVHRATWDDGVGWTQYHDQNDPLPAAWDDEPPDEVCGFVSVADLDAYGLAVWKAATEHAMAQLAAASVDGCYADAENLLAALPLPEQGSQK